MLNSIWDIFRHIGYLYFIYWFILGVFQWMKEPQYGLILIPGGMLIWFIKEWNK